MPIRSVKRVSLETEGNITLIENDLAVFRFPLPAVLNGKLGLAQARPPPLGAGPAPAPRYQPTLLTPRKKDLLLLNELTN